MIGLTTAHKENLERFQQNINLRVRLFKRSAGSGISRTLTTDGAYQLYIQLANWDWIYSIWVEDTVVIGKYTIFWSDNPKNVAIASIANEHWYPLISHDSMGFMHTLSFDYIKDDGALWTIDKTHIIPPLYAKYLKMVYTDNIVTDPNVIMKSEDYFDITDYLVSEITRTKRMDKVVRHYQRPTAEIFLDNADGLFNRRNTSSPYYQYLKSGVRFTIDAKFMGAAWEDPAEWIPMGSYRAKKFSKNDNAKIVSIYGEAGRQLTLQKTTQRIFEQVPVRKFAEYLLKDDQQQKPVCALLPRKTQVRTAIGEELGIGRFNDVEYEITSKNICEDNLIYSSITADDAAIYIALNTINIKIEHNSPPSTPDKVSGTITIIINGGANSIQTFCTSEHYTDLIGDEADIYPKICSDGKYIYLFDCIYDFGTTMSTYDLSLKKIDIVTGRIVDEQHNVLSKPGPDSSGCVCGPFYDKKNDVLIFGERSSNTSTSIIWRQVSKTTLIINGTTYSKSYTELANKSINGGYYDEIFEEWHFLLVGNGTSTDQYELVVDSSFTKIDAILLDDNLAQKRRGLIIRSNKDIVMSIFEGTDSWIYTHAKRQFWLKGNIQDTNGPMTDTVFYDQPEVYQDQIMDNTGTWDGYVVETNGYWLNTKTGELILKRPLKEGARLWANYDYHPSLNFPEIKDMMRYAALQQAAETENRRVIIDERENVNLKERIYEEVIPTMDYSVAYNTILTFTGTGDGTYISPTNLNRIFSTTSIFSNVQKHDEVIITADSDLGLNLGTFLIKAKITDTTIEVYHTFNDPGEACLIDGSVERCAITWTPKSVKLGQTYEGKGNGLLNIIHDANHKTIRVFSMDFLEELAENTDYMISTASGYITINFLDTARVRNNPAVVVQYRIQEELYSIVDTHNVITETEGWNEDTIVNKVTVKGQKLLPDVARLSIVRQYAAAPYSKQNRSDLPLIQEANSTGQFDWTSDDERTDYSEKDVTKQNFLLEFEHPLIIGTTAFTVIYGDESGIEKSGTVEHTKRDAVYYWEITGTFGVSGGAFDDSFDDSFDIGTDDPNYMIMISNRREFRVCTAEDYRDMVDSSGNWKVDGNGDEIGYGAEPSSADDMKTAAHFYIKQMNGAYAREDTKYIVYNIKAVDYYIDEQGRVIQGSIDPNENGQGVFTGYPNKAASIIVTPKDSQGAVLFDMHGVSGSAGYNNGANYADINDETYALQITRVQIDSKGANLKFNNWGEIVQYIQVSISGYPLSRVEKINVEANPTAQEVADYGERDKEIENLFIGETYQAKSLAFGLRNFYKDEKSKFSTAIMLAPHLQLEDIVEVTNPYEYLGKKLMEILEIIDHIQIGGASTSNLVLQEVEDGA